MKKIILLAGLPLLLVAGAFVTLQAVAAEGPAVPAEEAVAAPMNEEPVEQPTEGLELEPMDGTCSASFDCDDGTTVQCSGTSTCKVLNNGVECDGVAETCGGGTSGSCVASTVCEFCSKTVSCSSNDGNCLVIRGFSVSCDGVATRCAEVCGPFVP